MIHLLLPFCFFPGYFEVNGENKRFWVNAYDSYVYGHPDIQHLSGARQLLNVKSFKSNI